MIANISWRKWNSANPIINKNQINEIYESRQNITELA